MFATVASLPTVTTKVSSGLICTLTGGKRPGATLPARAGSIAALEATYRFLTNPKVTAEALFGAHAPPTIERAAREEDVLVIHDTTEFSVRGSGTAGRHGAAKFRQCAGFLAHFSPLNTSQAARRHSTTSDPVLRQRSVMDQGGRC